MRGVAGADSRLADSRESRKAAAAKPKGKQPAAFRVPRVRVVDDDGRTVGESLIPALLLDARVRRRGDDQALEQPSRSRIGRSRMTGTRLFFSNRGARGRENATRAFPPLFGFARARARLGRVFSAALIVNAPSRAVTGISPRLSCARGKVRAIFNSSPIVPILADVRYIRVVVVVVVVARGTKSEKRQSVFRGILHLAIMRATRET